MIVSIFKKSFLLDSSFKKYPEVFIGFIMLVSSLVLLYHFRKDLNIVYRHWDGPFYMYIAKVGYNIPVDHPFRPLPQIYFASHLPAYPFLIRVMSLFTLGNYPFAMIFATQVSAIAACILYFRLLRSQNLVSSPIWTAILFCFFPAGWLISHTIGASEPLFQCFIFGSLLAFYSNRTSVLIICIILASITRITGLLLIPAFALLYAMEGKWKPMLLLSTGILGISAVFFFYSLIFGDFFAYFRWNMDRVGMIRFPPLEIYRLYASRINLHSTVMYYMLYVVYGVGLLGVSKYRPIFVLCLVFYVFALFIYDFGLHRHLLPIAPFCLLLPLNHLLNRKAFKFILFPFFLYLTYLYAAGWIPFPLMERSGFEVLLSVLNQSSK